MDNAGNVLGLPVYGSYVRDPSTQLDTHAGCRSSKHRPYHCHMLSILIAFKFLDPQMVQVDMIFIDDSCFLTSP